MSGGILTTIGVTTTATGRSSATRRACLSRAARSTPPMARSWVSSVEALIPRRLSPIHTATSGNATIKNAYLCSSDSRYIEITPPAVNKNSYGNQYNAYAFRDTSFLSNASIIAKITNTGNCYTPLSPSPVLNESGTVGISAQFIVNYVYLPINSSGGSVYYFISGEPQNDQKSTAYIAGYAINGFYARGELWLYDVAANTITSLYSEQNNCNIGQTCRINTNLTGTLNLGANKLYYLITSVEFGVAREDLGYEFRQFLKEFVQNLHECELLTSFLRWMFF
jgi:hypothetical protein